jgi:small subunit ribosomal protein S20
MPILKNAKKALRVSKRKAAVNLPIKSKVKNALDKAKRSASAESVSSAFSAIDKAVKSHIIHKKKAARLKSQASRLLVQVKPAKPVKPAQPAKKAK